MVETHSLFTSEIDDSDLAREDILAQLASISLRKHSVGIVICHYDFVTGGVVRELMGALPFPLAGVTTFYQAAPQADGLFELTITVLTSDDVRFSLACSDNIAPQASCAELVRATYREAFDVYKEAPGLVLSFLSPNRPISGDEYLRLLDDASGGVPSFGAVSIGDDTAGSNVFVFCQDKISEGGFAVLLLVGDVKARFYHGNYKTEKLLEMAATVTRANGTVVEELNGQPAAAFLRNNSILDDSEKDNVSNVPYLFKAPGEAKLIARTLGGFDPAGPLTFFAEIPEGSLLRIGTVNIQDLLDVAKKVVSQAVSENRDASGLLIFSCLGRYVTLGLAPTAEMEYMRNAIPENMPFVACYAGGEICPVPLAKGPANCYHNASFVVCALS